MIEKLVTDDRNRSAIHITEADPSCFTYTNRKLVTDDRNWSLAIETGQTIILLSWLNQLMHAYQCPWCWCQRHNKPIEQKRWVQHISEIWWTTTTSTFCRWQIQTGNGRISVTGAFKPILAMPRVRKGLLLKYEPKVMSKYLGYRIKIFLHTDTSTRTKKTECGGKIVQRHLPFWTYLAVAGGSISTGFS